MDRFANREDLWVLVSQGLLVDHNVAHRQCRRLKFVMHERMSSVNMRQVQKLLNAIEGKQHVIGANDKGT